MVLMRSIQYIIYRTVYFKWLWKHICIPKYVTVQVNNSTNILHAILHRRENYVVTSGCTWYTHIVLFSFLVSLGYICFISGVTILLSLTVFLNMVAETMPATSDAVPLLGKYFILWSENVSFCLGLLMRNRYLGNLIKEIYLFYSLSKCHTKSNAYT